MDKANSAGPVIKDIQNHNNSNDKTPISRDNATRQKIISIIDHQFDIELCLKQRELATIRREIAMAESVMEDLNLAIKNAASMPESPHFTRRSAATAMYYPSNTPKKNSARNSHRSYLYGRRNDGLFVKLGCPTCKRDDFANQQGFLNHCRIAHGLEFGPYEQIMQQCGTLVDEADVPLDHPARMRSATRPVPVQIKPIVKKERPTIKVFEEDVDLELDQELAQEVSQEIKHEKETLKSEISGVTTTTHPPIAQTAHRDRQTEEKKPMPITTPSPIFPQKSFESAKSLPETEPVEKTLQDKPQVEVKKEPVPVSIPVESFAAAHESGSRFYIKRRIIVGNVSKYIASEKREPTLKHFTHKWMIYVVEPPQAQQVTSFITSVRFHLHPSYKPHDVVDVTEPPFRLTRLGWGEFPIRIQLHFVDKRRNKTVDVIHHLKLDDVHSGRQVLGNERGIDIELDRNTDFKDMGTALKPSTETPNTTLAKENSLGEHHPLAVTSSNQRLSLLHSMLKEHVRHLPMIRSGLHSRMLPYTCAPSILVYFQWSVGKRKGLEWHRAHLLRLQVQQRGFETMDTVLRVAATALTTKDVVGWCKEYGYTPQKLETNEVETVDKGQGICKFCGCLRALHTKEGEKMAALSDYCLRKPQGWSVRKRASGLNSVTSVSQLLSQLEPGWDVVKEADDMDVDVDMESSTAPPQPTTPSHQELLANAKEFLKETPSMTNERCLDWIWSVVSQLRLKTVVANDITFARDGSLQILTSSADVETIADQRLVTGNIMAQATRAFLKRLLTASIDVWSKEKDADSGEKMLVPHHIYQATQAIDSFDFLTHKYMGPFEKDKDESVV
ncbi:hypothetical protein BDF14DRAFT_1962635 [Spinellus fusiger]|nr:hypothetical protein BDF14DRAFT_1962635 [Spinellus fusiger]